MRCYARRLRLAAMPRLAPSVMHRSGVGLSVGLRLSACAVEYILRVTRHGQHRRGQCMYQRFGPSSEGRYCIYILVLIVVLVSCCTRADTRTDAL